MSAEGLGASSVNGSVAAPPRGTSLPPAPGARRARRADRGDLNLVGRARREPPRGRAVHGSAPPCPRYVRAKAAYESRVVHDAVRLEGRAARDERVGVGRRDHPCLAHGGTLEPPATGDEEPAASCAPRRGAAAPRRSRGAHGPEGGVVGARRPPMWPESSMALRLA